MSSEEDFTVVASFTSQPSEMTLEEINEAILLCKMHHEQLLGEQKELIRSREDQRDLAEQFRQRSDKLLKSQQEDERCFAKDIVFKQTKVESIKLDESRLRREIQTAEATLDELEADNKRLKEQTDVSTGVPEKKVVFTGLTGEEADALTFDMKTRIVYPMEGGTALITFEEEVVAQKILALMTHKVDLGAECTITLEAKPVHMMLPKHIEMDTKVCPRRILISNLPRVDTNTILDKLEIHFSKTRNGGGEVEECDMLHDSGNVVLAFLKSDVAKGLTEQQYHHVEFERGKKNRVKVIPFLNGKITKFQARWAACPRTVLLTGIPAIMDHQENMSDLLEIHFQKPGNGGGEVDAFLYNPLGQNILALFLDDCPNNAGGGAAAL
ncbi:interferon-induced 35 kDa protein [Diretmus argenteus]